MVEGTYSLASCRRSCVGKFSTVCISATRSACSILSCALNDSSDLRFTKIPLTMLMQLFLLLLLWLSLLSLWQGYIVCVLYSVVYSVVYGGFSVMNCCALFGLVIFLLFFFVFLYICAGADAVVDVVVVFYICLGRVLLDCVPVCNMPGLRIKPIPIHLQWYVIFYLILILFFCVFFSFFWGGGILFLSTSAPFFCFFFFLVV